MTYFRLLDEANKGTIVRATDRLAKEEWYNAENSKWESHGGLALYFAPYDDNQLYDLYEEISEAEAMQSLK